MPPNFFKEFTYRVFWEIINLEEFRAYLLAVNNTPVKMT
jgi:hypothetical protein